MRDRTPTRALENGALRYGVYAEDGSLLRHEYLALEDDPTDPGTDLSKSTLLQDSTEVSLFGSAADRTVDDAFAGIAGQLKLIKSDMAAITLTVQDTNGKPIPEVLVQGILSESGQAVYTNANGVVTGYIGEGAQVIKVSGYADLEDYSETVTVVKGTTINKTIKLTTRNFLKITSSRSIKFSGNVSKVDISVVGAGGGGQGGQGTSSEIRSGSGGWSGSVSNKTGIAVAPNVEYHAIVGAGGDPGSAYGGDGIKGGDSKFMDVVAPGGSGGSTQNNGTGSAKGGLGKESHGNGNSGQNSSAQTFKSFSEMESGPGGGGGGAVHIDGFGGAPSGGKGGEKNGANGGDISNNGYGLKPVPAKDNSGAGGGGGPAASWNGSYGSEQGSKGGSGCVAIRMHLKSAA